MSALEQFLLALLSNLPNLITGFAAITPNASQGLTKAAAITSMLTPAIVAGAQAAAASQNMTPEATAAVTSAVTTHVEAAVASHPAVTADDQQAASASA